MAPWNRNKCLLLGCLFRQALSVCHFLVCTLTFSQTFFFSHGECLSLSLFTLSFCCCLTLYNFSVIFDSVIPYAFKAIITAYLYFKDDCWPHYCMSLDIYMEAYFVEPCLVLETE